MSLKSQHPPLTWSRIEQLACAGHDDFEPPLNAPRARQLVESVLERFGDTERLLEIAMRQRDTAECATYAANATIARVRGMVNDPEAYGIARHSPFIIDLVDILASQPEAPKGPAAEAEVVYHSEACRARDSLGERCDCIGLQAYASNQCARANKAESDLAAAEARIADLVDEARRKDAYYQGQSERLAAANALVAERDARIADLEVAYAKMTEWRNGESAMRIAANARADAEGKERERLADELARVIARADAAERAHQMGINAQVTELESRLETAEDERDQLAQKLDAAVRDSWAQGTRADEAEAERDQLAARLKLQAEAARKLQERVDAAERRYRASRQSCDRLSLHSAKLTVERDQLAARVKWLEARWEESDYCTPEERNVLDACRELLIFERGSTAYVPPEATEDLGRLLHAELANRAAKAKRGGA